MGFPLSFSKSRRAKKPGKVRLSRFEVLEERSLLSAVGVAALDSQAFEGSEAETGVWRVERTGSTELPAAVPFKLTGSAVWGADYQLYDLSSSSYLTLTQTYNAGLGEYEYWGSASFPAGTGALDLEVRATADQLQEPTETAVLTLVPPAELELIGAGSASINIIDANSWLVQIAAVDSAASESPSSAPDCASFTVTRAGTLAASSPLTVKFELSGSADPNSDYTLVDANNLTVALSRADADSPWFGYLSIPAGQTSASFQLRPANDSIREESESATIQLVPGLDFYNVGANSAASATVADNDAWTVNVTSPDPVGAETNSGETPDPIVFRLSRTGESDLTHASTVWFAFSGTADPALDVSAPSGAAYDSQRGLWSASIPANAAYLDLAFSVVNDASPESTETLTLYLVDRPSDVSASYSAYAIGSDAYATAQILDSDSWTVEVAASSPNGAERLAGEPSAPITFTVTRTGTANLSSATTVYCELSGTARPGYDYVLPGGFIGSYGSVTIPAGQTSASLTLDVLDDRIIEGSETVVLRALDYLPAPYLASGPVVQYALGAASSATAAIADNELAVTVAISASDPLAQEPSGGSGAVLGTFRITRACDDVSAALTVTYALSGTAENGTDYAALTGVATIPAGASYVDVSVTPLGDALSEPLEMVVATLVSDPAAPTPYLVGASSTAAVYLVDSDPFGTQYAVPERGTAQLSAFTELDAAGWTVEWDLDGDSVFGETGSGAKRGAETGPTATYNASALTASATLSENIKPIAVRVSTAGLVRTFQTSVELRNVAPIASVSMPTSTTVNKSIRISGTVSDPGADSFTGTILFGDETPPVTPTALNIPYRAYATSHRYSSQGWYDVTVTVDDGKDSTATTRRIKVGSPTAVAIYEPAAGTPVVSGGSALVLTSTRLDGNGTPLDPEFNEPIYRRFQIVNHGNETLTFDVEQIALPANVTLMSSFPSSLEQDESAYFTLKWTAKAPLNGSVTIPTSDPTLPLFSIPLTGSVQTYVPPDVEFYLDGSASALVSGSSTVTLKSFERDSYGALTDAKFNESVYRRFRVVNRSSNTVTFGADSLALPNNVSVVGDFPSALAPDEEQIVTLEWIARSALSGTVSLTAENGPAPLFSFTLAGAVQSYAAPTVSAFGLLYDSGADSTDGITYNPILSGAVAGDFARGQVEIEFDLDSDGASDGSAVCYAPGAFQFDPRTSDAWTTVPTSQGAPVSVRYRAVHYDDLGAVLSTGAWTQFGYTVTPAPQSNVTVSNLSASSHFAGGWSLPNGVALSGSVSDASATAVEIEVGTETAVAPISETNFTVALPFAFAYGTPATVRVRAIAYDSASQMELRGAWTAYQTTPALPSVVTQGENALAFGATESGVGLSGKLTGLGAEFCEVEISQITVESGVTATTVLGSAWTDGEGAFFFAPTGLSAASGVLSASAVWREGGAVAARGSAATVSYAYTPSASAANLTASLPDSAAPTFTVSADFPSDADPAFEYRWKFANASEWSAPKQIFAYIDEEGSESASASGTFTVSALRSETSDADVDVQVRASVYDRILGGYAPASDWTSFAFTYTPVAFSAASISTLTVSDARIPTLSGSVSYSGDPSGIAVKFYSGNVYLGSASADSDGAFTFRPTNLTPGAVDITAYASQWNPRTRTYASGPASTVSFTYAPGPAPVAAPQLAVLELWDDTGADGDGVTANAAVYGKIDASDGESTARLLVEYDVDGDGAADGWLRSDASGEFLFTPTLTPGACAVSVRAARWNDALGTEICGAWQSVAFTYQAPSVPSAPTVRSLAPDAFVFDAQGRQVTRTPWLSGRVSSETGYENVQIEYEVQQGGTDSGVIAVGPNGAFCLNPELTASSTGAQASVRVRAGLYDPIAETTAWGAWSNSSFVYESASESVLLGWTDAASDRAGAGANERKISGVAAPGVGIDSFYIEIDVDGDGTADGRSIPNSNGEYTYYFTPTRETVSARAVDVLADGSTRASEQGWTRLTLSGYTPETPQPSLGLYFRDSVSCEPYLQLFNGASATVALDYDYDGEPDAYAQTNGYGQITHAAVVAALADADVELKDGFSVVSARLSDQTDAASTPVPLLVGVSFSDVDLTLAELPAEQAQFKSFATSITTLLDYDPTGVPAPGAESVPEFDEQTTDEPPAEPEPPTVGSQADWNVLENTPIPEIAFPTLDGENVDFSQDAALLLALDEIQDAYDAAVRAAEDAWRAAQSALEAKYDRAVDEAWNTYSRDYERDAAKYAEKEAELWTDSDAYKKINKEFTDALDALNDDYQSQRTELNTAHANAIQSRRSATGVSDPDRFDWHEVGCGCPSGGHTDACWANQESYRQDMLSMSAEYAKKELSQSADYQKAVLRLRAQFASKFARGELEFETAKNDALAGLAQAMSDYGKTYEEACAAAFYAYYAGVEARPAQEPAEPGGTGTPAVPAEPGLADADEAYRNAVAEAAQTAVEDSWSEIVAAVVEWQTDASTPAAWGDYLAALYTYAETNRNAYADAYVAETAASAAAQKARDAATAAAYRDYLISSASATNTAERSSAVNIRNLHVAAAAVATSAAENNTILQCIELAKQTSLIVSAQRQRADDYMAIAPGILSEYFIALRTGSSAWYTHADESWLADSFRLLDSEIALYGKLLESAERLEKGVLTCDANRDEALWALVGNYRKEQVDVDETEESTKKAAVRACETALDSANKTYLQAELTADGVYEEALKTADVAQETSETTLAQTTVQNQYGTYFTALASACGAMANATAGAYYGAAVAAAQALFSSQNTAATALKSAFTVKADGFAQSLVNLTTAYFTSVIDALFATHEPTPTETEANKVTAAKKAAIDAEIVGRQLCVEARRDRDLSIAEADADAVERRLAFTKKYGVYELNHYWYPGSIDVSMPFDYFATKSFYLDGFAGFSSGAFEGFKKSENVSLGTNSAYILDNLSTQHMASPFPPATNGAWDAFNPLNANVAAVQKKEANLLYDFDVANYYELYVEAVTAEFRKEEVAALNVARMEYADGLASETALKNAILTARGTALSSYVTALENADCTSNVLTFSSSLLNSSSSYGSSMASAYGDLQIGTRQNILGGVTSSDPRYGVYSADVGWAQETKSLRNQYYAAVGTAESDYYSALATHYGTYNAAATVAKSGYELGSANVEKTLEQNVETSRTTFALAQFDAAKDRILAELDATAAQITADAAKETELALARYSAYCVSVEDPLGAALAAIAAVDFETSGCVTSLSSANSTFASVVSNAANADAALAQTNADALAAEKTQNAALRDAAIDGADSAYKVTVRNAWNNSYLMNLASGATAKTDDEALAAAANASLESAAAAYRAAAFADYGAALDDLDMIDRIAAYQQERVDRGISVPNDAFADLDDPDFEYQVCFAAGTPVLMADGTTKPIETVRPGDLVLASDHLDPESKPVPARVVRFFDNGLKGVVRVRFEGGTELVCTPGHRFYVAGQGWKHANELALGDACLSADGKRVAFEGRDAIAESAGVFNLEVEGKHTYFVGGKCILVHNADCLGWFQDYCYVVSEAYRGTLQGAANIANGIQDIAVDTINLVPAIANTVANATDRALGNYVADPIRIPYIPSPDWSRGLITQESGEPGSWNDTHNWSKISGAAGVSLLTPAKKVPLKALEKTEAVVDKSSHFLLDAATKKVSAFFHKGRGARVGFGRKLLRFGWEDRKSFGASKDFYKRRLGAYLKKMFPNYKWSMEHMIIKQRWYRGRNPIIKNPTLRKVLQGFGDAGWNLIPMPQPWNRSLYDHRVISAFVNYGTYPASISVVWGMSFGTYRLSHIVSQWFFSPFEENTDEANIDNNQ